MTIKKEIAGNGRADKDQMVETARRYGWTVTDDNQADALCLWLYAVRVYAPRDAHRFDLISMGAFA
jgi:Holliday junction resolvasome RuvABC endonuclease subunit